MCKTPRSARRAGAAAALALALAAATGAAHAAPLRVLHSFTGADGALPANGLVAGPDGFLYGDTDAAQISGGASDTVYKIRPDGTGLQTLHTFPGTGTDGAAPNGLLLLNGFLYGTTLGGGTTGSGVIFKMDTAGGSYQILHTFTAPNAQSQNGDGGAAGAGLTLGPDGALYGTTLGGGTLGGGVVFRITPDGGVFQVLYAFPAAGANGLGSQPNSPLALGSDGFFYGTTQYGGSANKGAAFRITPSGQSFADIHDFTPAGGTSPQGLIFASDGNLYGTAFADGPGQTGTQAAGGSLFQLSPGGAFRVLRGFTTGSGQIAIPLTPPVEAPDGTLFGATNGGGAAGTGVVYEVNKDGTNFQIVASLSAATGDSPNGPLLLANRKLYGTARAGGASSQGTLFAVALASVSHLLWGNTDGTQSLWTVTPDNAFTFHNYGPYGGWTASALADTPDGDTHLLWNHSPDGQVSVWDVTPAGAFTFHNYGPFSGWTAIGMSAGPDGRLHLLWNHSPDSQMSLWGLNNASGVYTHGEYGPYPGYSAKSVATGGDGVTDVVWRSTDGTASTWRVSEADGSFVHHEYGPYSGWSTTAVSAGPDGLAHLLWGNTNGTTALWSADFASGGFTQNQYGPYPGWSANAVATGADGITHLLWDNTNGTSALWALDGAGGFTQKQYGPYPGWTATALDASQ